MQEDHPEFKKKKKDGKDKKSKRSRSRSHKKKHSSKERKRKDASRSNSRPRDMNSQERRAMIEQWNQEEENQEGGATAFQQSVGVRPELIAQPLYDQINYIPPQGHFTQGGVAIGHVAQTQYQQAPQQQFYYNEERAKNSGH